jgi:hypothetical protein
MYKLKIVGTWLLSIVVTVFLTMQVCSFKLEYYRAEGQPFFQDGILWVLILGAITGLVLYAIFKLAWDQIKPNNLLVGGKLASITTSTRSVRRRKGEQL